MRERVPNDPPRRDLIIYDLEGELFFGAAPELDRCLEKLKQQRRQEELLFVVLRLKRTRNPDMVSLNAWNISCMKWRKKVGPFCCVESAQIWRNK